MNYCIVNGAFHAVSTRSNELYHYGVKGMRWGHRKAKEYEPKPRTARKSAKELTDLGKNKASALLGKSEDKTTKVGTTSNKGQQ